VGEAGIFSGLAVLELGVGAAGPVATRSFAEQGARVVRVESARRPDFLRLLQPGAGLDAQPMFALLNAGKESLALDLARPEAREIALRLVDWADVLVENFSPGVLERLGLDPELLRRRNPALVIARGCLFGQTGPQRDYPGFGGQGSAIAGFNFLTGWADREAIGPYATITDSLSPRYLALAVAAALLERRRPGRGRTIDLSQIETGVYSLSEMVARQSAGAEPPVRRGNRSEHAAPHGVYPCRGEDRWVAIAVRDDAQWRAFVGCLGEPAWATDPRFDATSGRLAHQEELDRRIASWTRERDATELAEKLQAAGVEAGPVQHFLDLLDDPQLAHRDHFRRLRHAQLGELACERSGLRLSASPGRLERPGPLLGEHSRAVLGELLGFTDEEIARLEREGVVA
jgi:benzylsuccinate CoA-transferase BbsF subunit